MTNRQKTAQSLLRLAKEILAADTFKCPDCGSKVLEQTGYCVKCKKKVKKAKELTADDLLDNDSDYREFVAGAKKFGGRYKGNGVADFPQLGLKVNMSGNETKFYFSFGKATWGRLWSAEDALKAVKAIDNLRKRIDMESM